MKFETINDKVFYYIDELFYNVVAGAIELPTKLVMIDTGINLRKVREFKKEIEEKTGKKFKIVFITHYHGDHLIGNQEFKDARIISAKEAKERAMKAQSTWTDEVIENQKKRINDPQALEGLVITPPNEDFENEIEIEDNGVKVVTKQTGGHSDCSLYVYCPNYKVVFVGDNLFVNHYPWGGEETANPDSWIDAFNEYLSLDVEYIIPGHGPAIDKEELKYSLNYFELVKKTMKDMSKQGKTEEEILKKCFDLEFYPINQQEGGSPDGKNTTLKRWYDYWIGEQKKT